MLPLACKYRGYFLMISFLMLSTFFLACQGASESLDGTADKTTGKAPLTTVSGGKDGGLGRECEGFDILRNPVKTSVEAMPCAQSCPTTHAPVCTSEGLTYPNACYAALAKAVIAYQGECQ